MLEMRRGNFAVVMVTAVLLLPACHDDGDSTGSEPQSIVEIVSQRAELSTLAAAIQAADLSDFLESDAAYTFFAPVNTAFDAFDPEAVGALLDAENQELLQGVLTYHLVEARVLFSDDLTDGEILTSMQGQDLEVGVVGGEVTVNDVRVVTPDIEASNGVIHEIDAVLLPEVDVVDTSLLSGLGTWIDFVRQAGLEATLRNDNAGEGYTVFGPIDAPLDAVDPVPTGQDLVDLVSYHVVSGTYEASDLSDGQVLTTLEGGTLTVNIDGSDVSLTDGSGAMVNVIFVDALATNGVVHTIDGALQPG